MKTKNLRRFFAIAVSCAVAFCAVMQTGVVAFAADSLAITENTSVEALPEMGDTPVETSTPETEDDTLDAKKYWVAFDANGGKIGMEATVKTKQTYGEKYILPANPQREGYSFKGWYTARSGGSKVTSSTTVNITQSTRLYAQWVGKKYLVAFDAAGGKMGADIIRKTKQTNGEKYVLPANPQREGYSFKGWYTMASGGLRVTASTKVNITQSTRLFAQWAEKKYWVAFDATGGKIGTDTIQKTKQTYGTKYILPVEPVWEGYTFKGWYTEKSGGTQINASSTVSITKSTRLFAQWEAEMSTNAAIVVEAKINLSGSGTGWHGKLVIQDGNTAVSFGIQHDTHSGIGPQNQDYLMFESVRNSPSYHSYTGYKAVGPGWHTIRLEYYEAENKAVGYCDGELIGEVFVHSMQQNHISINKEAIPRVTGDVVDASFKDMFVYTKVFYYNGNAPHQEYGTFAIEKSEEKSSNPHGYYIYNEQGEIWRLHGTANIPNGGDWDSYPTVGVRMMYIFVRK